MKDKNTISQVKFYMNIEKEIKYINEMNKKGWKLVYIKGGCIYTFVKTEPDEYKTILYAEKKENISHMTAFVSQYGYENIPHTMDGLGDMMYLTGKKSEINEDFVDDTQSKLNFNKIMKKRLSTFCIIYHIEAIFVAILTALYVELCILDGHPFIYTLTGILGFVLIFTVCSDVALVKQKIKYKKNIKELQNNSIIYE